MFGTIEAWEAQGVAVQERPSDRDQLTELLEREGVFDAAEELIDAGLETLPTIDLGEAKRRMEHYCGR